MRDLYNLDDFIISQIKPIETVPLTLFGVQNLHYMSLSEFGLLTQFKSMSDPTIAKMLISGIEFKNNCSFLCKNCMLNELQHTFFVQPHYFTCQIEKNSKFQFLIFANVVELNIKLMVQAHKYTVHTNKLHGLDSKRL